MTRLRSPLTILIDKREQRPWEWTEPGIVTKRATLGTGDYSVLGFADSLAIERKSLDDLVSTAIHASDRWHAELKRMSHMLYAAVVVEANLTDLIQHRYTGKANPHAVLGRTLSIQVDFGIPIVFAGDRPHARLWSTAWLIRTSRRLAHKDAE